MPSGKRKKESPQNLKKQLYRWILPLVVFSLTSLFNQAFGQSLSWEWRCKRCPKRDRGYFLKHLKRKFHQTVLLMGYRPTSLRANRSGYHLVIWISLRESLDSIVAINSVLQLAIDVVIMPQRRLVSELSFSGRGEMENLPKINRARVRKVRNVAIKYALEFFRREFPSYLRQIKERAAKLPKGRILGQPWGKRRRGSRRGKGGKLLLVQKNLGELRLVIPRMTLWQLAPPPAYPITENNAKEKSKD